MFKRILLLLALLSITMTISGVDATAVHGTVYSWSDFEKPLKNVIVEIEENSTRVQYKVSTTGEYNFTLSQGNYRIKAKYYRNNILELTGEENIRIEEADESKEFDLLLFPPTEPEYEYLGDINLTGEMDIKSEYNPIYYIITILILVFSALMVLYRIKKKKSISIEPIKKDLTELPPENVAGTAHIDLPEDLREVYELILKKGGRTTQKELRKEIKYSEAKVSLMLDDLENRGSIKKIKKGRANIIIAEVKK